MTRFRAGDMVYHGARRGEVIVAVHSGYDGQLCSVRFGNSETWIMADDLEPVVERLRFKPRIVGGRDHHPDTLPSEITL